MGVLGTICPIQRAIVILLALSACGGSGAGPLPVAQMTEGSEYNDVPESARFVANLLPGEMAVVDGLTVGKDWDFWEVRVGADGELTITLESFTYAARHEFSAYIDGVLVMISPDTCAVFRAEGPGGSWICTEHAPASESLAVAGGEHVVVGVTDLDYVDYTSYRLTIEAR